MLNIGLIRGRRIQLTGINVNNRLFLEKDFCLRYSSMKSNLDINTNPFITFMSLYYLKLKRDNLLFKKNALGILSVKYLFNE